MKNIEKEVRSDKVVIGVVKIPVFETLKEMVAAMKEPVVLALANRQNASDTMNTFRAAKTSTSSPTAQLNKLAKTNPDLQKAIEALVSKYASTPDAPPAA